MAKSGTTKRQLGFSAVGLLFGLVIGIMIFGAKGGVGFGVAMGLVLAIAFGSGDRKGTADTEGTDARGGADPS